MVMPVDVELDVDADVAEVVTPLDEVVVPVGEPVALVLGAPPAPPPPVAPSSSPQPKARTAAHASAAPRS